MEIMKFVELDLHFHDIMRQVHSGLVSIPIILFFLPMPLLIQFEAANLLKKVLYHLQKYRVFLFFVKDNTLKQNSLN